MKRKDVGELLRLVRDLAKHAKVLHPHKSRSRSSLVRKASLPHELMVAAITATAETKEIAAVVRMKPARARAVLESIPTYDELADDLQRLLNAVRHTRDVQLAELGAQTLQVYHLAKGLGRDDPKAFAHAEIMRKIIRNKRPKRARKKST